MAVDKKYLKESNLENVYKRMRQINEYVITNGNTFEADDMQQDPNTADPNAAPVQDSNMQAPSGNPNAAPDMAADPNTAAPADPNMVGDPNATPDPNADPNGGMPPAEPDPTIGAEAPDMGEDGEPVEDVNMEGDETETVGPDDEVLDVDDLTNSQEAAEYKIDGVDDKLTKLLTIASKFAKAIEDNDNKINDLKAEVEKRNPTDIERINIRSQNSQPFSVNPGEYWDGVRAKNPNYQVVSDNEVSPNDEDKVYTITDDDIKDFNTKEVEKSFSDFPKDLMDYFK